MVAARNVLWFSHLVPYPQTGLGVLQRSYNLVRELARSHRVYLLAFVQSKIVRDLLGDLDTGLAQAREHLEQYCSRVEFLTIPSEGSLLGRPLLAARSLVGSAPYTIRWLRSERARRLALEWSSTIDFDVVHFDTLSLAPYRKLFTRAALTLDHHNIESNMMLRRAQMETQPLKKFYFWQEGLRLQQFERRACPEFDLNITCSRLDTERLAAIAPGIRTAEIPNGVDTEYFQPGGFQEEPLTLVFAGNLSWYPNAAAMLFFANRIWPALKRRLPGVRMDVVGGHPPQRLLALAAEDGDFRVHGFVPDVRPYIGRAGVYICPIMDGGGTKLKVLDAFAMGKAMVAHPVACEGIEVLDGYDVILAQEPEEFVSAVASIVGDAQRRQFLSHNARALAVAKYSYERIGRELVDELERCCLVGRARRAREPNHA